MDELKKFFGKPKSYVIEGEQFDFTPLKGKDIDLLIGMKEGHEAEGMALLVTHYLKDKYPTITKEQVGDFSVGVMAAFIKAIFDVNGMSDDKPNT